MRFNGGIGRWAPAIHGQGQILPVDAGGFEPPTAVLVPRLVDPGRRRRQRGRRRQLAGPRLIAMRTTGVRQVSDAALRGRARARNP
jgi:hypothetical protein